MYNGYTMSSWYGLKANCECGVSRTSYVNAKALYVIASMSISIATQPLFTSTGETMLMFLEFNGVLDDWAQMIGYNQTSNQLIADSAFDSINMAPWCGFPMQDRTDLAFAIGTVAFHPVVFSQKNRHISEMVVNYESARSRGRGVGALPFEVSTGAAVSSSTVDFTLATMVVWVSKPERLALLQGYNEIIFKENLLAGEHVEQSCNAEKKVNFDLNLKGPCTRIVMTVQSQVDIDNGNWTKLCDDYGQDYIRHWMIMTGTTAREDGLPVSYYRTVTVLQMFHCVGRRHVYVMGFECNATSKLFTGHQTMTNIDKLQISMVVKPHRCNLRFTSWGAVYNGCYTERGTAGLIWG